MAIRRAPHRTAPVREVIPHCAHDLSLTGAEGPTADLGRPVVLWTCDECGAVVHLP